MQPTDRQIRVFVSSTFQDMKVERDHLVKVIFPQLRKLCESRGVVWGEVDLRWGITDEEQAEGKILPVCLQEIDRCRPYFIGLLGERYGWVPEQIPDDLVERQPWLREHRARSVTELEMLHGILRHETVRGQGFFYFRDPGYLDRLPSGSNRAEFESESPEAQANLSALKHRLREAKAHGLCGVREPYPDYKTLGDWILEDVTALINERFPEGSQLDPLDRDALDHEAFAQSRAKVYIGRQAYFDQLEAHVAGNDPPLVVLGESGGGKSALLANWFLQYQQTHPETLTLIHFIGATPYSAGWDAMLRRILGEFKRRFDIREEIPTDPNALRGTFANWLHRAAAKGKVVLMLDALNQLEDRDGAPDLVWLPAVIPPSVRMIVSTLPGRALDDLTKREWPNLTIEPLQEIERKSLIREYLAQYTKVLSPGRVTRIAAAPQTANPLYLRILLGELRLHGVHETLEPAIEHYLKAETISDLYGKVLARWEQDYEGETDLVGDALSVLWAARRGLSETEWRELLGIDGQPLPQATFVPFLLAVESGLVNRAGLLTFAHDYLREAVQEAYVPSKRHQQVAHRRLADYFARRPLTARHLDELPWQLAEAAEWRRLAELLGDESFLISAWHADQQEVCIFWAIAECNSSERVNNTYTRSAAVLPFENHELYWAAVGVLLSHFGYGTEARNVYGGLLMTAHRDRNSVVLRKAFCNYAILLQKWGDVSGALDAIQFSDDLCRASGDLEGLALAVINRGNILREIGQLDAAMLLLIEGERISMAINNREGLAAAIGNQAMIMRMRGNNDRANQLHQAEEGIWRELGNLRGLARCFANQAMVLQNKGDLKGAVSLLKLQEGLSSVLGDIVEVGMSLGRQANCAYLAGDLGTARRLHHDEEKLFREVHAQKELAICIYNQVIILMEQNKYDDALRLSAEMYCLVRQHGLTALAQQFAPILQQLGGTI